MDAGKSSPLSSSKSKEPLHSPVPLDQKTRKVSDPDPNPWSVRTPLKPADRPQLSRQVGAALSIKDIRESILKPPERGSKPRDRTDPILGSEKEQVAKVVQKSVDSKIKLPEKYELLNEFFDSLYNSIMLSKRSATFTNLRPQIEKETGRTLTYCHLAQLKFIMPEAILLETVHQRDEQTGNLNPDLRITLNFEVIGSKSKSKYHGKNLQLRKLFHDRLLDFFKSHLEGDEVPKEALPEPFNHSKGDMGANSGPSASSSLPETPLKCTNSVKDEDQCSLPRTPADLASTPANLMIATPMLQPPKRCFVSPDDNSSRSPSKLRRRPPPNRALKFDTPVKSVKVDDGLGRTGNASADNDVFDILPEALVQSIREKERLASIEQDPAISQAKWRRQMIAKLPKLFDLIYFLFQSIRRSVVTKEELIHKIILGHLDITDRREIEEQLRLLQELAPEWIYEKSALSGDLLICVNQICSPAAIRTRLSEAK